MKRPAVWFAPRLRNWAPMQRRRRPAGALGGGDGAHWRFGGDRWRTMALSSAQFPIRSDGGHRPLTDSKYTSTARPSQFCSQFTHQKSTKTKIILPSMPTTRKAAREEAVAANSAETRRTRSTRGHPLPDDLVVPPPTVPKRARRARGKKDPPDDVVEEPPTETIKRARRAATKKDEGGTSAQMPVQTAPSASVSAQMEPTDEIIARAPTPTLAPSPTDPNAPVPPPSAEAQATEENFARAPTTAPSTPPANLNPPVSPRCALMEDSDEVLTLPPPAESNPPVSPRSALIEPTNDVPTSAPQPTSPCAVAEEPSAVPASHPPAPPPPAQPTRETGRRPYTTMAATAAMQVLQNSEPQAHLRPLAFAPTSAPPLFGTSSSGLFGSSSSSVFHGSSQRLFGGIGGSKTPSGLFRSSGSSVFYGTSQNSGDNFGGSGRSATPPYWSFGVGASSHPRTSDAQLQSLPSAQPLPPLVPPPSSTGASVEITAQVQEALGDLIKQPTLQR
ncbi:hypothetical protein DFH06DRAFT_1411974 [Mycena polygramma]|nr:hypothetical protein DFH06DRAFT_1411974 [Mycena polygramma]